MERKYSIDILRIISAIAVVIIHTVSAPVTNSTVEIDMLLVNNLKLIHTLMNWSVPVFFMITGYCALKKQNCTYNYCFSHVIKYVCVLFTVGLFYALLEEVFNIKTLNFLTIANSVKNVISGNIWDHMWFVYSIIGIYLVLPVICSFMKQGKNNGYILTILLFVFSILVPTLDGLISIQSVLPFGGYLFYVCFGGLVAQNHISNKALHLITFAGLLSCVWIVLGVSTQDFDYKHLAVCLMAISIFLIFNNMDIKPRKMILLLSNCMWGVYLIHPFFINIVIKLFKIDFLTSMPYIKLCVFAVVIFCISVGSTYVLRKIPLIKKLF